MSSKKKRCNQWLKKLIQQKDSCHQFIIIIKKRKSVQNPSPANRLLMHLGEPLLWRQSSFGNSRLLNRKWQNLGPIVKKSRTKNAYKRPSTHHQLWLETTMESIFSPLEQFFARILQPGLTSGYNRFPLPWPVCWMTFISILHGFLFLGFLGLGILEKTLLHQYL